MLTVKLTLPDSTRAAPLAQHLRDFADSNGWRLQYSSRLGYVMCPPNEAMADITAKREEEE